MKLIKKMNRFDKKIAKIISGGNILVCIPNITYSSECLEIESFTPYILDRDSYLAEKIENIVKAIMENESFIKLEDIRIKPTIEKSMCGQKYIVMKDTVFPKDSYVYSLEDNSEVPHCCYTWFYTDYPNKIEEIINTIKEQGTYKFKNFVRVCSMKYLKKVED